MKNDRSNPQGEKPLLTKEKEAVQYLERLLDSFPTSSTTSSPVTAGTIGSNITKSKSPTTECFSLLLLTKLKLEDETPCWKVVDRVMEYFRLLGEREYELRIHYQHPWSRADRVLGPEEKPLNVWRRSSVKVPDKFSLTKTEMPYVHGVMHELGVST
jgi:hypothetical protein